MIGVGGVYLFAAAVWSNLTPLSLVLAAATFFFAILAWIAWRRLGRWKRATTRWRSFFESIGNPAVITDLDGRILECTASARSVLGIARNMRRSRHLLSLIEPGEKLSIDQILKQLNNDDEEDVTFEAHPTGSTDDARLRVHVSMMSDTNVERLVWSFDDVTEFRKQIDQYEAFLDHLIRNTPLEVAILSPDGRYLYLSSSFIADERRREWLLGRTDFDYCKESGLHLELALRRRAHRVESIDRRETVFFEESLAVDGEERRLAWRYCPFIDAQNDVTMVVGYGVDITDLVRCRTELADAQEEVLKSARLKEALLQNVSHEIRTPLAGIIGTAQMLQPDVPEAIRDFLVNIEDNGRRLAETLNEMLDLAGLQAESVEMQAEIVNLSDEVREVLRSVQSVADRRGLFLRVNVAQPEILVRADRGAVFRCIRNLVDNAVKFTTDGGILLDVSASYEYAYLRVMDSGVGIEENAKEDVFEAFSQEEVGLERSFEGVGLGLAVTKQILATMDGEIRVHSRKGAGSSFVVRLPLVEPELRRRGEWKSRVLVADPHKETHRIISHMLSDYFEFEAAHSLEELAEHASSSIFDVILVDSRLHPDLEPHHLLESIHAIPEFQSIPSILIDHQQLPGRKAQYTRQGWDDCVAKPLSKLDLLNVLYTHCGESSHVAAP
jgi:PAS domain S-box-containing protein